MSKQYSFVKRISAFLLSSIICLLSLAILDADTLHGAAANTDTRYVGTSSNYVSVYDSSGSLFGSIIQSNPGGMISSVSIASNHKSATIRYNTHYGTANRTATIKFIYKNGSCVKILNVVQEHRKLWLTYNADEIAPFHADGEYLTFTLTANNRVTMTGTNMIADYYGDAPYYATNGRSLLRSGNQLGYACGYNQTYSANFKLQLKPNVLSFAGWGQSAPSKYASVTFSNGNQVRTRSRYIASSGGTFTGKKVAMVGQRPYPGTTAIYKLTKWEYTINKLSGVKYDLSKGIKVIYNSTGENAQAYFRREGDWDESEAWEPLAYVSGWSPKSNSMTLNIKTEKIANVNGEPDIVEGNPIVIPLTIS